MVKNEAADVKGFYSVWWFASSALDHSAVCERRTLMRYHDVEPITRQEAEKNLASADIAVMCLTLVRIAFFDPDAEWVEGVCTKLLAHPAAEIRSASATCLGHLARIHRDPELARVRPLLSEMLKDPEVRPFALDALEDIDTFLGPQTGSSFQKH
jgi:HEAT repeat